MLKVRSLILTALLAGSSLVAFAAPASATCHEYIEGRCLENDVCAVVSRVRPVDCIE